MIPGLLAAVGASVAYGVATLLQAVGARRAGGLAALRQPAVLGGLALDGAAFLVSLLAFARLPLFVVEAVIAATKGDADGLRNEAADLVFHLAVLLESVGLGFEDVLAELERREGLSGLAEKAARSGVTAPEQGDRNAG